MDQRVSWSRKVLAAAGLLLLCGGTAFSADAPSDLKPLLKEGVTAPDIEAATVDGTAFSLKEELSGGPVFLVFWSIF